MKIFPGLILLTQLLTLPLIGQTVDAEKALKHYQNMGYMAFADALSENEKEELESMAVLLANSYRLNGNPEAAAFWYSRAIKSDTDAELLLHYAQALQSAGNCKEAIEWYQKYLAKAESDQEGLNHFVQDCNEIRNASTFGTAKVEMVKGLNTTHLDFAPVATDGGIIFTSSRNNFSPVRHNDLWTKKQFTNLFFAPRNEDGTFGEAEPLFGKINKKYHDGAASVVSGGEAMFFTRNNLKGKNSKKVIDLKIYYSEKKDGFWGKGIELPFNSDEFGNCHPALSNSGKVMVFSSDRPGGLGGMDLYLSTWENGSWSAPQNLGPEINTGSNEIFPFLGKDDRLYFSSNGRAGLGGLDLFSAEKTGGNTWSAPINLGTPMNSEKDDFGIFVNEDGRSGFLSSSRGGGLGGDDIYEWSWTETPQTPLSLDQVVVVVDAATNQPIPFAQVKLVETTGQNGDIVSEIALPSDPSGKVNFSSLPASMLTFEVEKPGYAGKKINVPATSVHATPGGYKIPLTKNSFLDFSGNVVRVDTDAKIPGAELEFLNLCDNSLFILNSDQAGLFASRLTCGCKYRITTRKTGYVLSQREIFADCELSKREIKLALLAEINPTPAIFEGEEIATGKVVRLKNVFYDFDKWAIRSDASYELEKVVRLMNEYPGMEIELGSHTDSRGNDNYNANLSKKRAEAAVQYIIFRGIAAHRISAKGYGESQLVNRCGNGVQCSDEEHQENRRTEIRITRLDDEDVEVIYEND